MFFDMKACLLGILLITLVSPTFAASPENEAMSDTMSRIVKHHLRGKHDFETKSLPKVKDFKKPADDKQKENYQLPSPPGAADYFSYQVILNKDTQQYWIIRSGGFAGRRTVFGPGDAAAIK